MKAPYLKVDFTFWMCFYLVFASTNAYALSMNNFLMTGPKAYLSFAESVAAGIQRGVQECQRQFKWDRWNCPQTHVSGFIANSNVKATREASFMQAISCAGVMYTLTRNCSVGNIDKCSCDDSRKGQKGGINWLWGGCSDNIHFGERISRLFVDALETGKDARAAVNLHNNDAGRKAVRKTLHIMCKCHGVSGSCTTKTCWQQLADLYDVGQYLKRKYHRAVRVEFQNGALYKMKNSRRDIPAIKKTDLVYVEVSPNYCHVNNTEGTYGTLGRECIRTPRGASRRSSTRWERKSCRELCLDCGLRVKKKMTRVQTKCNCKFHWCCEVRCHACVEDKAILTCTL